MGERPWPAPDLPGRDRSRRTGHHSTARLRFDVGVQVTRRFRSTRDVGYQPLAERWCAATSYVGPHSGLAAAYQDSFRAASALRGYEVLGLPVEEKYLSNALLTQQGIQVTQVLIPPRRTAS